MLLRQVGSCGLLCLALGICMAPSVAQTRPETADVVLRGGKVITLDPSNRVAEAVAVRGNRILSVGSSSDLERYVGPRVLGTDPQSAPG
jgi:hypothetical protein